MRHHLGWAVSLSLALSPGLAACAAGASPPPGPALPGHWVRFAHAAGVVDLAGPHGDGWFTVAAAGRLLTLGRAGALRPFARGPGGYSTAVGPEPYIIMAGRGRAARTGCSFRSGAIFALQPGTDPGIIAIGAGGQARRFASLPASLSPTGIAFDTTGRFGHRLVVTASSHPATSVLAIDCAGFVPPGFGAGDAAYLADRYSKGNRHPGTDSILRLPGSELIKAGVRAGDLLVATEAGARTIAVRCTSVCTVRYIAAGPGISHAEGHIVFTRPRRRRVDAEASRLASLGPP